MSLVITGASGHRGRRVAELILARTDVVERAPESVRDVLAAAL
jgi:hypothetical protein